MIVKIGINGFGWIGCLVFCWIYEFNFDEIEVVVINDLMMLFMLVYLLKYDFMYGKFFGEVFVYEEGIIVDGKKYLVYVECDVKNILWVVNDGVDFVFECIGFYIFVEKF